MLLLVALGSSGCFLRALFGSVGQRDEDFGIVFIATIGGIFGPLAVCDIDDDGQLVDCTYSFFDIESETPFVTTSTAELISEFGLFGVFVDPLIVQVPADASNFVASLDDGTGAQAVPITEVGSFAVQPGTTVLPEPGRKFVILDFPAAVLAALASGTPLTSIFNFALEFQVSSLAPVEVKAMFTGKVEANGETFYPPMLPCTTSFANVPAIQIPVAATSQPLLNSIIAALQQGTAAGCDGQVYDLTGGTPAASPHYLLYKTRTTGGSAPLPAGLETMLRTAFDAARFAVTKTLGLGTPADKNGETPGAPASPDHFVAYQIEPAAGEPKPAPRTGVAVTDQFGQLTVDTKKPDRLLVPAAKGLTGPVEPPTAPGVDHFTCYRVTTTPGTPKLPKGLRASLTDQFAQDRVLELKKPTRLCLPTDKAGEEPDAPDHPERLMCYGVKLAKKYCAVAPYPSCTEDADCPGGAACVARQPKFPAVAGIHVADQLTRQVVQTLKLGELCVPAQVAP
jgi:hypothetical protein